jgi:hypothetical protein
MTFSVYLKVSCSPILHTIGLNDLFQCDISHLVPSLLDLAHASKTQRCL